MNEDRRSKAFGFTITWTYRPRRLYPHPLTLDNRHCVAFARGPFIYCAETIDNESLGDLRRVRIDDNAGIEKVAGKDAFKESGLYPILLKTVTRWLEGVTNTAGKCH